MIKAQIITKWNKDANGNVPDAVRFLRPQESMMDVTGEQKVDRFTVNPVVCELWCSKETVADIEAAYGADAILKTEPFDAELDKTEVVKPLISDVKVSEQLTKVIGVPVTLDKISAIEWIKTRPVIVDPKEIVEEVTKIK